ncbi:MAG: tetraacyldisaccharide 4'-kinase [Candidatus Sumerlaeota bacterium]|nr:tetraacyldisaccharide 4'-kinase [Candidatus Sumerlaeota bacterium]
MYKILQPLAFLYESMMRIRLWAYKRKVFKSSKISIPVICVGNITMGGTGKTPIVIYLAGRLKRLGKKPAIVSRGYKRKGGEGTIKLISDGRHDIAFPETGGDEPVLIARSLPGVPVIVGANRYQASLRLLDEIQPDVIVMDDGFQHLSFHRDLDILVFDVFKSLDAMRMFPAGTLREPLVHCRRAQAAVISKTNLSADESKRSSEIRKIAPDLEIFKFGLEIAGISPLKGDPNAPTQINNVLPQLAVCGIGNPDGFIQLLRQELQISKCECLSFWDHYNYTLQDIQSIEEKRSRVGAQWILTTEKDAVKIETIDADLRHWLVIKTQAQIKEEDSKAFDGLAMSVFARAKGL